MTTSTRTPASISMSIAQDARSSKRGATSRARPARRAIIRSERSQSVNDARRIHEDRVMRLSKRTGQGGSLLASSSRDEGPPSCGAAVRGRAADMVSTPTAGRIIISPHSRSGSSSRRIPVSHNGRCETGQVIDVECGETPGGVFDDDRRCRDDDPAALRTHFHADGSQTDWTIHAV
jgi:hypothetical protein